MKPTSSLWFRYQRNLNQHCIVRTALSSLNLSMKILKCNFIMMAVNHYNKMVCNSDINSWVVQLLLSQLHHVGYSDLFSTQSISVWMIYVNNPFTWIKMDGAPAHRPWIWQILLAIFYYLVHQTRGPWGELGGFLDPYWCSKSFILSVSTNY